MTIEVSKDLIILVIIAVLATGFTFILQGLFIYRWYKRERDIEKPYY